MDGALERSFDGQTGEPGGARDAQPAFAATLPVRGLPRFTPAELLAAVNKVLAPSGAAAELVPELTACDAPPARDRIWQRAEAPPRVGLNLAGITLLAEAHDRPAFAAADTAALDLRLWPDGARALGRTRGHVSVVEAAPDLGADFDHNHDRAAALTAVAAAASGLVAAAGVVWAPSGVAVPAAELRAAVPALMQGDAPVLLWVGAGATERGSVATRGLYPLLGAEVEVRARGLTHPAAAELAMRVAEEIVGNGEPPGEGEEVAPARGAPLRVRYRGAEDGGVPAVVLEEPGRSALPAPLPLAAGAA